MELHGIVHSLEESLYHAHPSLSSTGARRLLESPAKFHYGLTHPEAPKAAYDLGSAVHAAVLGVGSQAVAYPDDVLAKNGAASTTAAKEWAEAVRADGLIPVKRDEYEQVTAMREAVLADAANLFEQDGHAEASLFATDPETGVDLRARYDYLAPVGVDLKTTAKSAKPARWQFTVHDLGYDVQAEHYRHVRKLIQGEAGRFVFVAVETTPPYLVWQHELDEEYERIGARKALKARLIFAECTASGIWPRAQRRPQLVHPPMPAIYDYQDNYA